MKHRGTIVPVPFGLTHIGKCVKLIAVAAAIFLLSASFDDVPDSPGLLNSKNGPASLLQLAHHDLGDQSEAATTNWGVTTPPALANEHIRDALVTTSPPDLPQALRQAADPSPPVA